MSDGTNARLRLQCAWCGRLIEQGASPTSHGICDRCYGRAAETAPPPPAQTGEQAGPPRQRPHR